MYPADQIWRNIQKEIHGDGKWPALTYISIFIITALVISTLMVKPEERLQKNTVVYSAHPTKIFYQKEDVKQKAAAAAPLQYAYAEKLTQQTLQSVSEAIIAHNEEKQSVQQPALTKESLLSVQNKFSNANAPDVPPAKNAARQEPVLQTAVLHNGAEDKNAADNTTGITAKPASRYLSTIGLLNPADLKKSSDNSVSAYNDDIWRNFALLSAKDLIRKKLSKLSFQFYITPSISYRRLNDAQGRPAKSYTAIPVSNNYHLDVNHMVENRSAVGAEVGFALGYQLTRTLTLKGGFQFNLRQYGIKAYTIPQPVAPASSLPGNTVENTKPDEHTDNAYLASADQSSSESHSVTLNNRYYEVAAPIGIDWLILTSGNGRLTVNAAAALQPTYTFDKEPFVLTTNYKSYTDGASIMRNWNLNSNVEAYISYKIGPFRWQLGPQFRYQHFSTYSKLYPIREHLIDYGVKLGFTKSLD